MATSWDQTGFVWNHGAAMGTVLKGTFRYGNLFEDIEVKVPLLGTKTTTVTISGVKFQFRAGPNKCSVRTTGKDITGVDFAYGIYKSAEMGNDVWPNAKQNPNWKTIQSLS